MKDLASSVVPRSTTRSRFRPISLPVYLDSKTPKRQPRAPTGTPPAASVMHTSMLDPGSGFQSSGIPRFLRPSARPPHLSKPSLPPAPSATTIGQPKVYESRCRQMLAHGLFVAFEDDYASFGAPTAEDLRADGERPFTHFISLSTRHKAPITHTSERRTGARRLKLQLPHLYSPEPPTAEELTDKIAYAREAAAEQGTILTQEDYYDIVFDEGEGSGYTGLEAPQLLAARDFLLASGLNSKSEDVRVLVTTPRDHRTDALAAVMGYLSLALRERVAEVINLLDTHPRILAIWKDTISEECALFLEDVCHLSAPRLSLH
ncbi:hypothetical protein K438DRAFT_1985753 [Mycena galopus ATCC 62051]|nr:hypothetical protein K438DRAFT_1985753 [Mycena galopus ATCC 62051]